MKRGGGKAAKFSKFLRFAKKIGVKWRNFEKIRKSSKNITFLGYTLSAPKKKYPPHFLPLPFFLVDPPFFLGVGKNQIFSYFNHTLQHLSILPYSYWFSEFCQYSYISGIVLYGIIWGQFWAHFGFLRFWNSEAQNSPKIDLILKYTLMISDMYGCNQNSLN